MVPSFTSCMQTNPDFVQFAGGVLKGVAMVLLTSMYIKMTFQLQQKVLMGKFP